MNKDSDEIPEKAPLIILYSRSAMFMDITVKDTKCTRQISKIMHFVKNGKDWNLYNAVRCEVGMQLEYIVTNNVR